MRETLYIRWRDDLREPVCYALVSAEAPGSVICQHAHIDEVLPLASGCRVVLMVPGSSVRLTRVDVPSRQASKVLQAAPYLLEEQLADDIDSLHYALGPRLAGGQYPVAVVAQAELESWLKPFREQDIDVEAVVPETLCLPRPEADSAWPVLVETSLATVRSGEYAGFSCLPEDLPLFLNIAEGDGDAQALTVFVCDDEPDTNNTAAFGKREIELRPGYTAPLQALVQNYRPAHAINLLQGRYSRRGNFQRLWHPWRLAAGLLLAVLAVAWLTNVIQATRLGFAADHQQQANKERFYRLFPDEPTSLALSLAIGQVARNTSQGGHGSTSLLELLQQTAQAVAAAKDLSVQELQYHDHALYATLAGHDLRALDRLRGWFTSHPALHLTVQNANATGNSVSIAIKVSAS